MAYWHDLCSARVARTLFLLAIGTTVCSGIYFYSRLQAAQQGASREQKISVGGVMRSSADTAKIRPSRFAADRQNDRQARAGQQLRSMPRQPPLGLDAHPSVAKLHDKIMNGGAATIGMHAKIPAFDFEDFVRNKDEYLLQFAPNRVFQAAQPGPSVPVLSPISRSTHALNAGESVRLQVRSAPRFPVTFVSLDLGTFQNKLNAITVAANEAGVAEVAYSATPGTVNRSHVIVGSPGASGRVTFELRVRAAPPAN